MGTMRKQTQEWDPWYNFSDDRSKVTCVFCNVTFSYRRERAFAHFGYKAKTEKSVCRGVPRTVRQDFAICGDVVPRRRNVDVSDSESILHAPTPATLLPSSSRPTDDGVSGGGPGEGSRRNEANQARHKHQQFMADPTNLAAMKELHDMNLATRKKLDLIWASFFYEANIPFNVARHPAFKEAVIATSMMGCDYDPPSFGELRTRLIKLRTRSEQS